MERKICPFMYFQQKAEPESCKREKCALWEEIMGLCSFKVIPYLEARKLEEKELRG